MCLALTNGNKWRYYGALCSDPERLERYQRKVHYVIYKTTGNMLWYWSCYWCTCIFPYKKHDRHDGSNIRNGCLCCSCDPLWIVQEKWYFLGKTGEIYA